MQHQPFLTVHMQTGQHGPISRAPETQNVPLRSRSFARRTRWVCTINHQQFEAKHETSCTYSDDEEKTPAPFHSVCFLFGLCEECRLRAFFLSFLSVAFRNPASNLLENKRCCCPSTTPTVVKIPTAQRCTLPNATFLLQVWRLALLASRPTAGVHQRLLSPWH